MIYKPVIKKLKQNAAEIGTIKLSIPKILNCSSIVEIEAIVNKFILKVYFWIELKPKTTIKLVINIVVVPNKDFFWFKKIQLLDLKFFPINAAKPSPNVIIKKPAISEVGSFSQ